MHILVLNEFSCKMLFKVEKVSSRLSHTFFLIGDKNVKHLLHVFFFYRTLFLGINENPLIKIYLLFIFKSYWEHVKKNGKANIQSLIKHIIKIEKTDEKLSGNELNKQS